MMKLKDLAKVIRSKNAGSLLLTLDVMFEDEKTFRAVQTKGLFTPKMVARLYGLPQESISVIEYPPAYAIKITFPRQQLSGDHEDSDVYGAQQHAPLLDLEVDL